MNPIDALVALWVEFVQFLQRLPVGATETLAWLALGFTVAGVVIYAIRRGGVPFALVVMIVPLISWGVSWAVRWIAGLGGVASEWLWPFYTLLVLISLVWSAVNLLRVAVGK
ncbi:MAG: hypothetical protein WAR37_04490 [Candidatus Microsaccharimonas sp.]